MPTLTQICYDKHTKKFFVRMQDSHGAYENERRFDTQAEAEAWLDQVGRELQIDFGPVIPNVKS
jgi:hypothetical protein